MGTKSRNGIKSKSKSKDKRREMQLKRQRGDVIASEPKTRPRAKEAQKGSAGPLVRVFGWEFLISHVFLLAAQLLRLLVWYTMDRGFPYFFSFNMPPVLMYMVFNRGEAPVGPLLLLEFLQQDGASLATYLTRFLAQVASAALTWSTCAVAFQSVASESGAQFLRMCLARSKLADCNTKHASARLHASLIMPCLPAPPRRETNASQRATSRQRYRYFASRLKLPAVTSPPSSPLSSGLFFSSASPSPSARTSCASGFSRGR